MKGQKGELSAVAFYFTELYNEVISVNAKESRLPDVEQPNEIGGEVPVCVARSGVEPETSGL